jgi:O-antigen/teichoic acid export membrane protein
MPFLSFKFYNLPSVISGNLFGFIEVLSRLVVWSTLPILALNVIPGLYGEIVLIYVWITIISGGLLYGQGRAVLRYYEKISFWKINSSIVIIVMLSFIISILLIVFLEYSWMVLYISILIVLHQLILNASRVEKDIKVFSFFKLGYAVLRFLAIVGLLIFSPTAETYIVIESAVITLIIISQFTYYLYGRSSKVFTCFCFTDIKKKIIFGTPLGLQTLASLMILHVDKLIVASYLGAKELGNYFFMFSFCSCVSFLFAFNAQRYEVKVYKSENFNTAIEQSVTCFKKNLFYGAIFFPIASVSYFIAMQVSVDYQYMPFLMAILYLSQLLNVFIIKYSYLFTYMAKNKYIMIASIFGAITSTIFMLFSINFLGLVGIVLASIIGNLTTMFFSIYFFRVKVST